MCLALCSDDTMKYQNRSEIKEILSEEPWAEDSNTMEAVWVGITYRHSTNSSHADIQSVSSRMLVIDTCSNESFTKKLSHFQLRLDSTENVLYVDCRKGVWPRRTHPRVEFTFTTILLP